MLLMAPSQEKTRVGKYSLAFVRKGRNMGKWLGHRLSQRQTIAHGKESSSTGDSSSERQNSPPSIATHLPADNQLPAIMSADERGLDLPLQPSQPSLYVNLPPPPPPPLSTISQSIRDATPVEQPGEMTESRKTQELYDIEKQHDRLMAAREDLMRYRAQLKMNRKKIHEIREKTGEREGSVMNQMRTFLQKKDITLPRDIEEDFEQIDTLRDRLGLLEAEYDDSETDYTMKEIEHSGKEMNFIGKLGSVHSRCPAEPTLLQIQTRADALDRAPVISTRDREMAKHGHEDPDSRLSEKALQLVVQTKVHQETEKIDETQARDLVLFTNKPNVDDWLVNTLFQSPIPPEVSNEGSSIEQAPQDWYWLGTIGAQFQYEELEDSHDRSKKHDSPLSSNDTISSLEPVLVLHTKGLR